MPDKDNEISRDERPIFPRQRIGARRIPPCRRRIERAFNRWKNGMLRLLHATQKNQRLRMMRSASQTGWSTILGAPR
jgi:hypothetical protein